ncbi:MAG: hypothetical protein HZA95_02505 [Candidatus Vogelbacteria bacterium]|nr:hypothetical protein [Candidatus Vogelbacteria bacterium]
MKKLFWKNWIVLLLGFIVLLMPFMGFPTKVSNWIYFISGLIIVILSYVVGRGLSYAYSAPAGVTDTLIDQVQKKPASRQLKKKKTESVLVEEINDRVVTPTPDYADMKTDEPMVSEEPFKNSEDSKPEDSFSNSGNDINK